ncbi:uroporphyrinogen decarboxylase family protein [Candidatus Sumerlaeota bacterium]
MSVNVTQEQLAQAQALVERCHARGGLAPVDIERFWEDEQAAAADPWSKNCPQAPMGIGMPADCVFAELGVAEDWHRLQHDNEYRVALARRYNDEAERIVGRRLLHEQLPEPNPHQPHIKGLDEIFEAQNIWHGESYWLTQSANGPAELEALLDRVEERLANLRAFVLPDDWEQAKARIIASSGRLPSYRAQRGPITFAMSVYGVENLIFLIVENPELAARFRDLISRAMLERARVLDEEAGFNEEDAPRGFYWLDDNCAMLNTEMYEFFGYPILERVFNRYCPNPADMRGQHSDSDMAHLLPLLGRLNLTTVNFGPTLKLSDIRRHLPQAVIHGQLAPFTFSRNEEVNIVAEFLRDFAMARDHRGLVFATAGSINNGSRLTGMRLIMAAIQEYGQY